MRRDRHLETDAKVCVRIASSSRARAKSSVTTWGAMTSQILALRDHLVAAEVTLVVMEATSDYWKPFYYLLEDGPFELMLVNARQVKGIPGRKTDVSDAAWLAQLGAHGLVRGSFVPPEPIRQLRDLTRTRTAITHERGREVQRLEKLLEDAGIKLSSVASDITGVSGRAMLEALIGGERDPAGLADLAKRRMRAKTRAHRSPHRPFRRAPRLPSPDPSRPHRQPHSCDRGAHGSHRAGDGSFRATRDLIVTIPGISTLVADVIIAETGGDMSPFPSAGHLASWAGTCPGSNESAGRIKSTRARPGNPYLKGALGAAALSVARSKNTYFAAKFRRIAAAEDRVKALGGTPAHDACRDLEHVLDWQLLQRPRRGLLYPSRSCSSKEPSARSAPAPGLRRHP